MWITTIHITLLEIKMEKYKNIYVLTNITKIRPFWVGKNNIFMALTCIFHAEKKIQ